MGFKYRPPTRETLQKRSEQSGSAYDSYIKDRFPMFSPKEGTFRIRFLPSQWEGAEHYGMDAYVHFGIGADNNAYLCLKKMKNESCPICAEQERAQREGEEQEYINSLRPTKRVVAFLIDRDNEGEGPKVWAMPWTLDRDITTLSIDKRSGEILLVDHPDDGYDVEFSREGTGLKTKYVGVQIARKQTPLHEDAALALHWLQFISDNPIPEVLNFYDAEYLERALRGQKKKEQTEDESASTRSERAGSPIGRSRPSETPPPAAASVPSRQRISDQAPPRQRISDPSAPLDKMPVADRVDESNEEEEAPPRPPAKAPPAGSDGAESVRTKIRQRLAE